MKTILILIAISILSIPASANSSGEAKQTCSVVIIDMNIILCSGEFTGSLTAVANGVPPFHYLWSTNDTTANIDSLGAGAYTVLMTDSTGCTATMTAIVTEPPPLIGIFSTIYFCDSCTTIGTVSGGTPPYTYQWCDGSIGPQMYFCGPGTCTVAIVDGNGCLFVDTIFLNPPPTLSLNVQTIPTSCTGCSDGGLISVANGGTPPYTFFVTPPNLTCAVCNNLPAGTYTVCVTDANGCTVCVTDTIADNPSGISFLPDNVTVKIFPNPFSGEATMEVNGEVLKYNPEFTVTDILGNRIFSFPVSELQSAVSRRNLSAGLYFYRLTSGRQLLAQGKLSIAD